MQKGEQISGGASCGNCMFYLTPTPNATQGFCRRMPPTPLLKTIMSEVSGINERGEVVTQPQIQYQTVPAHPPVLAESWCGEHASEAEYLAYKMGGEGSESDADETE